MSHQHQPDEGNPHPSSSHRSPSEIAADEAGEIGADGHRRGEKINANNGPLEKVSGTTEESPPRKRPTGPT